MTQRLSAKSYFIANIKLILPAAIFLIAGLIAVPVLVVYLVTHSETQESLNPSYYLLSSSDIRITANEGTEISGWWIPGEEGSAGIVLAPGYGMSRSEALSLAAALHDKGFNILIFGQRGSSASSEKSSTLGLKEKEDMLLAVQFLQSRPESDRSRVGIWGVDIGAYSALQAAISVPEVRAIAADSVYESILDFLDIRIEEELNLDNGLLQFGCRQVFRLLHIPSGSLGSLKLPVEQLPDRPYLFITGENRKRLGQLAATLYEKLPSKKEIVSLKTSRVRLTKGNESKEYDSEVADFFQQYLQ